MEIMNQYYRNSAILIIPLLLLVFLPLLLPGFTSEEPIEKTEPEIRAWSNFEGIRINGHLMEFGSSIRILAHHGGLLTCYEPLGDDLALARGFLNHYHGMDIGVGRIHCGRSAKERQESGFHRDGDKQTVTVSLQQLMFTQEVETAGEGKAAVDVSVKAAGDMNISGAYFTLELPRRYYDQGEARFIGLNTGSNTGQGNGSSKNANTGSSAGSSNYANNRTSDSPQTGTVPFSGITVNPLSEYARATVSGVQFLSRDRQLEVTFDEPTEILIRGEADFPDYIMVYIPVMTGPVTAGMESRKSFTLRASGTIDREPAEIVIDTSDHGPVWDGFGGNFRLQSPRDSMVIDYILENMPLGWSRNEMPWQFWHPELNEDPAEQARAGNLHPRVEAAMKMTQRLYNMGLPTMLAVWTGPEWSRDTLTVPGIDPEGLRGTPLNQERAREIYQSITSYILYLREVYGTEVQYFSFNESDLGINVRQTPAEHTRLIKELGVFFESAGLPTKVLLGDAADANAFWFIDHAMNDPGARPYMGPVSYHSWRGWDDATLQRWTDAAERMDIPLIIGEGSIDAAGHRYGRFFEEQVYALEEINLYTRILAINRPMTILQWQLTSDYSVLAGGGIYGNDEPLRPTVRYWNLLQLANTPCGLNHLTIGSSHELVTTAAMGDISEGIFAIHLVNNGAAREARLSGLPDDVTQLRIFTTNSGRDMEEGPVVSVHNGRAKFQVDATSFVTLMTP
jgi:hypothetical protein